jgi:hypothetical protein
MLGNHTLPDSNLRPLFAPCHKPCHAPSHQKAYLCFHMQGCYASGRPRPHPPDVRTHPTIPRTSALAAIRLADGEAVGRCNRRTEGADRLLTAGRGGRPPAAGAILQGRPTEADGCPVRLRRPSGAVRLRRPLSMTPISPFYTLCLLL